MTKKTIIICMALLFVVGSLTPAYCDDALKKLGRGLCNVATFPLEIFEQIKRTSEDDGPMAGMSYGIVKGVAMMCVRASVGVYEVVTFPFPIPKDYRPMLTDPEFFFEDKNW